MSSIDIHRILGTAAAIAIAAAPSTSLHAQSAGQGGVQGPRAELASRTATTVAADSADGADAPDASHTAYTFKSRSDSLSWVRNRDLADHSRGFRIVVSLQDRHLWTIVGDDTVLSAPAAVASGRELAFGHQEWTFDTPRGVRHVLDKEADPIWQPPEWLYAETAKEYGLKLAHLYAGHPVKLDDGRILTIKDNAAGIIQDGEFAELPTDEHIVFDNTLFVPPLGTKNRRVEGELGKYRLNLGDGYLLHGTPYKDSIGLATTHGCVRLRDDDIQWLYDHVPVGTRVYIY